MIDNFQREINYMRISLTDRCNLHCRYCRPEVTEHVQHERILRYEEILRIAKCAVNLGITRFKITGGEPLLRKGVVDFIAKLKALPKVEQVTLTTNGTFLEQHIPDLKQANIDGINISLDTLDENCYQSLTGGKLEQVLRSITATIQAGIKCKLNCVPLKTLANQTGKTNKNCFCDLVKYAGALQIPLRFIELMPLNCNSGFTSYTGAKIRQFLQDAGYSLKVTQHTYGNGPAQYYLAQDKLHGKQSVIGFIEPIHAKFCAKCNRIRLTSTGQMKNCLYSPPVCDLRELLRQGADDGELTQALEQAILAKPLGHTFDKRPGGFAMNEIGG
ncbi:GTP 3',8-cyclase MoaA [uncultured Phascolarctobacterium sp.]|uniref:GTP 3',8-cyclase MoaA n=1 Tax=uncultured Phascolarctobacterium sp. TaxID=512296 RepID=UPI002614B675|nr:GTP 3',8-cyclase MoaA [uncultured Phascolarctobacterium sp.]